MIRLIFVNGEVKGKEEEENFTKMDFEWKRVRFEFDAFTFVNVRLERSVRREEDRVYFFFFFLLHFRSNTYFDSFQRSNFPVLTGLR